MPVPMLTRRKAVGMLAERLTGLYDPCEARSIARQARSGGCIAYLGADTAVQEDWSALLSRLRSSSRLITALNELAVTKDA